MAERSDASERYLEQLSSLLVGSARERRRLCAEIRSHIDDALDRDDGGSGELQILEQLGSPPQIAQAWSARCHSQRSRQRRRIALLAAAGATAGLLAVAQHAQGGQAPRDCASPTTHHSSSSRHHTPDTSTCATMRLRPAQDSGDPS